MDWEFNPDVKLKEPKWLVDNLIPEGGITLVLAKSRVGKSYLVEQLAISLTYGRKFLQIKTRKRSVLLIDQDTTEQVLHNRLVKFANAIKTPIVKKLKIRSMSDLSLSDNSLVDKIKKSKEDVIIIDTLHSVAIGQDTNSATKMTEALTKLKNALGNKTCILVHHITEKKVIPVSEMMTSDLVSSFGMGSSAIIQKVDTILYVAGDGGDKLKRLYIRPQPKRQFIDRKPFTVKLLENDTKLKFKMEGEYKAPTIIYGIDADLMLLFKAVHEDKAKNEYISVNDIYAETGRKYTLYGIRASLKRLVSKGEVYEERRSPRLFKYRLARGDKR